MLSWIIIIFAIALLFGVIEISQLKALAHKLKQFFSKHLNNLEKNINDKSSSDKH